MKDTENHLIINFIRRFVVVCFVLPHIPCFGIFDGKMHKVDKILSIKLFSHNYGNFICFEILKSKHAANIKNDVLCECWPIQVAYEGV